MTNLQPQPGPTTYPGPAIFPAPARNGLAVASLPIGIVALLLGVLPLVGLFLSFAPTVVAIVFGIVGIVKGQRTNVGLGFAIAGTILGGITFVLYFVGMGTLW